MPAITRTIETDLCVVGAGLIGLAHALEARRRGLSVVLLERDARATGASVRHSGHLFFSALASGAALESAAGARERWLELARRAGLAAEEGGTLIIARSREELAVMEAAAAEPARQARIRSARKLSRLAPIPLDGVLGAFHAAHDLRIAPRSAPAALARLLASDPRARIEWGALVHDVEPGIVHTGGLRVRVEAIVLCPGAEARTLPAELWPRDSGLRRKQAQMLRLAGSCARRYRQTLADGLALLEHPGFARQPGVARVRKRLELEHQGLVEGGTGLLVTQLPGGDLVVGSAAVHTEKPRPYARERLDQLLLERVGALLGIDPVVRQRWTATHASLRSHSGDFLTTRPMSGVRIVQGVRSTAAALCHTHAGLVLDELLSGAPERDMYINVRDMRAAAEPAGGVRDHAGAFGSAAAARRRQRATG